MLRAALHSLKSKQVLNLVHLLSLELSLFCSLQTWGLTRGRRRETGERVLLRHGNLAQEKENECERVSFQMLTKMKAAWQVGDGQLGERLPHHCQWLGRRRRPTPVLPTIPHSHRTQPSLPDSTVCLLIILSSVKYFLLILLNLLSLLRTRLGYLPTDVENMQEICCCCFK